MLRQGLSVKIAGGLIASRETGHVPSTIIARVDAVFFCTAVCRKACLARIEYCEVNLWAASDLAGAILTSVLYRISDNRVLIGT
jgi:hypothetical protein